MKKIFLLAMFFILTGCASMNSEFDCPMTPGVVCKSLDQVNSMVDSGQIGHNEDNLCTTCKKTTTLEKFEVPIAVNATPQFSNSRSSTPTSRGMKIWIAPYEDTEGNFHSVKEIYKKASV